LKLKNITIKCVITDDEPLARRGLKGYVEKTGFLQLLAVCEDAVQLNNVLKQETIDLLFLDIEMPYVTGIDFFRNLANPPKVIFTTAFENYALQGFELDMLDYLLKPISFDRFLKACNKAYDYFLSKDNNLQPYFFVKNNGKLEKILFDEILFIEAMENYVAIYTDGKKIVTHSTLKSLQQLLPENIFIQTHKSYIIHIDKVTAIEGTLLQIGKFQVPVSRYEKEGVMEKLLNKRLLKK